MDHPLERYALRPVRSPQEWSVYHAIRRDAIFSALLPGQAYDEHDPDEFQHRHLPHALVCDGKIIGTVRIDLVGEAQAGLRLIAIAAICNGKVTAAFCSDSRSTPRAASAGPRSSSMPTRRR